MRARYLRWFCAAVVGVACGFGVTALATAAGAPPLFPWPSRYVRGRGVATISTASEVAAQSPSLSKLAALLKRDIALLAGTHATKPGVPITLALSGPARLGRDGYTLVIARGGVTITAYDQPGAFYATRTLLQLLAAGQGTWVVAGATIEDQSRFAYRGMHLDVARHFFSVQEVLAYLDLLAAYKLNIFHWHLTDDQGWRLEVPRRPRLTQVAAFREDRRHERFALPAELRARSPKGTPPYGGFYTANDVKSVVAYAAERNITVVPEIDWPGHSQAALAAYSELSCVPGKRYQVAPGAVYPFSDPLCPCKTSTMAFVQDVLDEVVSLFDGPYIHIGGDEVNTTSWNTPACEGFRKMHGLADAQALSRHFVAQVAALVRAKGRTPIVWQEAAAQGAPPSGAITMTWRNDALVAPLLAAGSAVVSANSSALYFDVSNVDAGPGYAGVKRVLNYEPLPAEVASQPHLLGVQGALWTEFVQTFPQAQTAVLPRLAALAEVAWASPSTRRRALQTWPERLRAHLPWLAGQGNHVFVPPPIGLPARSVFLNQTQVELRSAEPGFVVRYTLDGQEPSVSSALAPKRLRISNTTTVKARTFLTGTNVASEIVSGTLTRAVPASPRKPEPLTPGLVWTLHPGRAADARYVDTQPATKTGVLDVPAVPDEVRGQNTFGVKLQGFVRVGGTGIHTFCTTSNDGSLLFINDEVVVQNDFIHNKRTRCGDVALAAGSHAIKILYFDDYGAETLSVSHSFGGSTQKPLPAAAYAHSGSP